MSAEQPPPRDEDAPAQAREPEPSPFAGSAVNPYARPIQVEPEEPVIPGQPPPAGPARRLAGGLLIANAVLVLLYAALVPSPPQGAGDPFQIGTGVGSITPALIDVAIGVSLLRGSSSLAPWAIVRCVGGFVLAAAIHLTKNPLVVAQQAVLTAGIIGLLAGQASRPRTIVAGSAAGLCLALEALGLAATAGGSNPLAAVMMGISGDIESKPAGHVTGVSAPYEITAPNDRWHLRTRAAVMRDNPVVDVWLVRPDKDAHVIVVAEHVPDKIIPIEAYTDAIVDKLQKDAKNVTIRSRRPWPVHADGGRLVDAVATKDGMVIEWRYALVTVYGRAYHVAGFASRDAMPSVEQEIRAILDSLKLPESVQNAAPADVDPTPITRVTGHLLPYTLDAPDDRWRLRKSDVVKAENPIIDLWLTRPDLGAHVLVVAEQVDANSVVVMDPFVENVLESAKKGTTRFDVLERRPWPRFASDGVRVRVSLAREGSELEYEYGFYAKGPRAFQIIGFTTKAIYPSVERALTAVLDSFTPPP